MPLPRALLGGTAECLSLIGRLATICASRGASHIAAPALCTSLGPGIPKPAANGREPAALKLHSGLRSVHSLQAPSATPDICLQALNHGFQGAFRSRHWSQIRVAGCPNSSIASASGTGRRLSTCCRTGPQRAGEAKYTGRLALAVSEALRIKPTDSIEERSFPKLTRRVSGF